MKKNWRAPVAALMSAVFLLLTVTAELAHRHGSQPAELRLLATDNATGKSPGMAGKSQDCVACLLSLTQSAVAANLLCMDLPSVVSFLPLTEPAFHSAAPALFCTLRAPPAVPA
ncbi:MAG: hypothetical protein ONB48_14245 [candidate division KSB1 bacterium]|nr:hypothetical protein [candidate division KSB1 bacterium]MDZ7273602.1 hypothetical protein [candidate division KSB1 bacterium]MDZ7286807.1 hypothetical protein [candidate division KSB1 bacterium]MDZ7299836.1 hypothetical protein [candidate division KSB1 bacterium]MDZ7307749.1 hypothetical protein [candidate division KSB1 bacterium]